MQTAFRNHRQIWTLRSTADADNTLSVHQPSYPALTKPCPRHQRSILWIMDYCLPPHLHERLSRDLIGAKPDSEFFSTFPQTNVEGWLQLFASFPTGFLQIFALFTPGLLGRYRHTSADFDQTQLYSPILQYCEKYGVLNAWF